MSVLSRVCFEWTGNVEGVSSRSFSEAGAWLMGGGGLVAAASLPGLWRKSKEGAK